MPIAIIAITANGVLLGETLRQAFPGSDLFAIEKHAAGAAKPFTGGVAPLVERIWREYDGLIFIMATGIVVRSIAPHLEGKDRDPAVVVMDDAGTFAISLLSGHLGGANALAVRCGELCGSTPVITTATDANGLPSFDMLAKEKGWQIEDLSRVKSLNALLLEGKEIAVADHGGEVKRYFAGRGKLSFHPGQAEALASGASGFLLVTNKTLPPSHRDAPLLVLRPRNLCLGIGCNRGTSCEEIESVVARHLERQGLSMKSVACLATAEAKRDEAGLLSFAEKSSLPLCFYGSDRLNSVVVPSPPSEHAMSAIGATGVAEPAALLASGGGALLMKKVKDGNVTLSIAEMPNCP
ncbi:cobalt-precorrin 5A hydrolase [Geomonas sp. Red32]|uniref:cobalt-precorrin 5A hydrolase n=1 Tax=Geomonas sp. Red32 TaxID=2912856 RepID=UPI00202CEC6D|nr:cobalt-precorrin 5A hydrolase [Geomonas sp. Red32]MCM0083987.1 cobalt-precorrin 5A hydrolase [Geomonas sp. Red32]